ncbi:hypothetical protein SAMN06264364_101411 [Quadrisphaera granulorum]|uniref:YtxH-like protein n=1 Tax=Quadrisphaera granulorum TaxID=317664 RepID=A0A316AFB2_9ACTN|nr:hypothetical protein [Quadrisphaera granulorum]PWJ56433.1 hypothetical protein BXY45_101411 [Quadrisphaera granulorum]SZE95067.1 hypothetical protein SAMN06264364_101411 [Quadrisphaera granulorum]
MGKKSLLIGAAIGYVLGARAGRERYDQIASAVSRLWNDPKVKSTVDKAQATAVDSAKTAAASAKDAAVNSSTVQSVKEAVQDKLPGSGSSSPSGTTTTTTSAASGQPGSTTPLTPVPPTTGTTSGSNVGGRP